MLRTKFIFALGLQLAMLGVGFSAEIPRFQVEVMAALSKGGCNSGGCHGNLNGKGGFKLSLRGENAAADYLTLTTDVKGRRLDFHQPENSLLLKKPLGEVPHEGGVRFGSESPAYRILLEWIQSRAPQSPATSAEVLRIAVSPEDIYLPPSTSSVPLKVVAYYRDGSQRDISELACYEPSNLNVTVEPQGLVRRTQFGESTIAVRFLDCKAAVHVAFLPERSATPAEPFPAPHNYVDAYIFAKLQKLQLSPAPLCDDATFIRRLYLDCLGKIPTAREAQQFVADSHVEKRARLVEATLARPEFADFWAMKWSDLLRNEEKVLDRRGVDAFHGWIRDCVAQNKPVHEFVHEIIAARGSTYYQPATNYYRANRDPFTRAETTARLFLGVRLQCARCHSHPFDRWSQDDYYHWAAWFARIDYKILDNNRGDKLDKNAFNGEQIVEQLSQGEVENPRNNRPAEPRFLGADTPPLPAGADRTEALAQWLTSPQNEAFTRSQVNWIWYHFMGRGLVEPIDDVRLTNPASHPELLEALARDFSEHHCDLKALARTILLSRTYQLSSTVSANNEQDEANYARCLPRRLTAEQLLDAQSQVLNVAVPFAGYPLGTTAVQLQGVQRADKNSKVTSGDRFLKLFGKPDRLLACECERSNETTLNQVLLSLSDASLQERLTQTGNRVDAWLKRLKNPQAVVADLYWTTLSRAPTPSETEKIVELLSNADDERSLLQDITWAMLNSKEFMFRN